MKNNTTYKVGQAILTCVAIDDNGKCEARVDWVQPKRGFEPLIGRCPEFENNFSVSTIRLGGEEDTQQIVFEPAGKNWEMREGKSYAALIGWDPQNPKVTLDIKCLGNKDDFDKVLAEIKSRHATACSSFPAAAKNVVKFQATPVETEDLNRYRVAYKTGSGQITVFTGTVKKIVHRFTEAWKQDPRRNLESDRATWEKKDDEDRYRSTICPELPAPPAMLLESLRKQQQQKPTSA